MSDDLNPISSGPGKTVPYSVKSVAPTLPERIGRYPVESLLGEGGFGRVYLARDDQLNRSVAIKVPRRERLSRPQDVEMYLAEARVLASLYHPNIVPVYDVGTTPDGVCYVVSKLIEGFDLAKTVGETRLSHAQSAELIATVASALHYAHQQGLVHRDVKPANILLAANGEPFVADFGFALKDENFGKGAKFIGTTAYMSPEQARGEGHRVDGRADIFSLGVVGYELLVGRRPFNADSQKETLEQIIGVEARPPRQIDDTIPKELERICLKALSKRASERYTTAQDMADDLRHFLAELPSVTKPMVPVRQEIAAGIDGPPASPPPISPPPASPPPISPLPTSSDQRVIKIVPKGLRSFDVHDADFFLELLPGPRDRDGLPGSLRFWKTRITETDADRTFSVGLIYGPSGCGKSSLVKAGLLPRLPENVAAVYIEATAEETESRLLNSLRKRCPVLSSKPDLKETLSALRRGQGLPQGKKVLIVLDQFEQWLHANRDQQDSELVHALRQCDGGRLQCVVLVRDDFWMAATRFMWNLEVRLIEGDNSAAVDRFDLRHAQKILSAFGHAFGQLPEKAAEASKDQKQFVERAIGGLAQDGKVVCVRIALFAEMMKGKEWTQGSLKEVGGTQGVGVAFLEETFHAATAPPKHRYHQKAARAVLKALLPESDADTASGIKGHMRSNAELLEASGHADRPAEFDDLLRILDGELRLISPTDPEGADGADAQRADPQRESPPTPTEKYFQLTHDYLVPSLREWLTQKQKETRRGRAELLLADRAAAWQSRPENRLLPSTGEYLRIRLLTPSVAWTRPQRKMMATAGRVHGLRGLMVTATVCIALIAGFSIRQNILDTQRATQAGALVNGLLAADDVKVPELVRNLASFHRWTDPLLRATFHQSSATPTERLYAALALLASDPGDRTMADYLRDRWLSAPAAQLTLILDALPPDRAHEAIPMAEAELARKAPSQADEGAKENLARRQVNAAVALLRWGAPETAWPLLKHAADPRARSYLIHAAGPCGVDPQTIIERWPRQPDPTARAALAQMLGEFATSRLPISDRQAIVVRLRLFDEFENDADPGLHSSLQWILGQWGLKDRLKAAQAKLQTTAKPPVSSTPLNSLRWYVNFQGQTFAIIDAGGFRIGSPDSEVGRKIDERQHWMRIDRRIAVATTVVTRAQYRVFQKKNAVANLADEPQLAEVALTDDSPLTGVTWFEAAQYCNWLSDREGLDKCYEPVKKGKNDVYGPGMKAVKGYLDLTGYRLPTEAEWEFACRADTTTSRFYGSSSSLMPNYACLAANSDDHLSPVGRLKPNDFGLFDVHGNAWQWCDDAYQPDLGSNGVDSGSDQLVTDEGNGRVLRGGSFDSGASHVRSAARLFDKPSRRLNSYGFRPVRTLGPLPATETH